MGCCRYMARANAPIGSEVRSRRGAIGYVTTDLNLNSAIALFDHKPSAVWHFSCLLGP